MSDDVRHPIEDVIPIANALVRALDVHCVPDKVIIAGSIRRQRATVKDIEILYVGRTQSKPDPADMFATRTVNLADQAIEDLLNHGIIAKRPNKNGGFAWGEKNKLAVHVQSGIPVDFFSTTEECWFNYLVCRTGGAENNMSIATAAQRIGWKWNPYGEGFSRQRGLGLETERMRSEKEVYEFVRLHYREPHERK